MKEDKITIPIKTWTPTIAQVENGYILSHITPNEDLNIRECYVYKTFNEVIIHLKDIFGIEELK